MLLLPPPPRPPAVLTPQERDPAATAQGAAQDQARARRFRFRVYEGGEAADANTQYNASRAGNAAGFARTGIGSDDSNALDAQCDAHGRPRFHFSRTASSASSAFVAQSIAQEQLGEGLHNPPTAAAAAAYTRAGTALSPRPTAGVDISA